MTYVRQIRRSRPVAACGNNRSTRTAESMSHETQLPGSLSAIPSRLQRKGLQCTASESQKFRSSRLEVGPADDVYELLRGSSLSYDFGPVQLEALYNFLQPLGEEEPALGTEEARQRQQAHQVLIGAGFTW